MSDKGPDEQMIAEAQADFAVNLLRILCKNSDSSTIVSPISVSIALSMVFAGAQQETGQEICQLLAKGAPEAKVHEYFGALVSTIQAGGKKYALEVANKVFVKSGLALLDTFKTAIDTHYGGQFESVDFEHNVETAKDINQFVEDATHGKIHDLISPGMLDSLTRMVLINAIYFKGDWVSKFNPDHTQKKAFFVAENNQKEVDMMAKTTEFIYEENEELQLLGMPYVGREVHMFVLLPKERFGLPNLLANLKGKTLLELIQQHHSSEEVNVLLPKFKLESKHSLNEPLQQLGLSTAFTDAANFGGITSEEPLKISQVIQKAFIEVNEEGTEAAAATGIVMMRCMAMPIRKEPKLFHADHSFIVVLASGDHILFCGIFKG